MPKTLEEARVAAEEFKKSNEKTAAAVKSIRREMSQLHKDPNVVTPEKGQLMQHQINNILLKNMLVQQENNWIPERKQKSYEKKIAKLQAKIFLYYVAHTQKIDVTGKGVFFMKMKIELAMNNAGVSREKREDFSKKYKEAVSDNAGFGVKERKEFNEKYKRWVEEFQSKPYRNFSNSQNFFNSQKVDIQKQEPQPEKRLKPGK